MSGFAPAADPCNAAQPVAPGRRRWLKAALAGTALPVLGFARRAGAGTVLGYGCGPGCDDPAALAELQRLADAKLAVERLGADEAALDRLGQADGAIDFFLADSTLIEQAAARGLAAPLTGSAIDRIGAALLPPLRPPFGPLLHDGLGIALPVRWGWIGPVIDTTKTPADGWPDYSPLFDPKRRGRIGALVRGPWLPLVLAQHAGVDPFLPLGEDGRQEFVRVLRAFFKNEPVLLEKTEAGAKGLGDGSLEAVVGAGSQLAARLRRASGGELRALAPSPRDGLKQALLWLEAAAVHTASDAPEAAMAALVALFDPAVGHALSLAEAGPAPSASEAIAALYSETDRSLLQLADADTAWQRGRLRRPVPDAAALQAVWDEERANAA